MKYLFVSVALAALPTLAFAQTTDVATAAGTVAVPVTPKVVVALDLPAIDDLTALGVTLNGVPDITPPTYLADSMAQGKTVGTLFEPDLESLAVMAPGLIVAGGRSQAQVAALSQVAPTIDMTIANDDVMAQARDRITAYGAIFAKEDAAASLLAGLDASIADGKAAANGRGDALILMANGGKISAYGAGSRFGWLHTTLGIPEANPGLTASPHGEAMSFEFVAETNPDWIFVIDRGAAIGQAGEAAAATLDNPLIAGTTAGQADHIVYLDAAQLYLAGGGIQSMTGTIAEIATAMDPDAS